MSPEKYIERLGSLVPTLHFTKEEGAKIWVVNSASSPVDDDDNLWVRHPKEMWEITQETLWLGWYFDSYVEDGEILLVFTDHTIDYDDPRSLDTFFKSIFFKFIRNGGE